MKHDEGVFFAALERMLAEPEQPQQHYIWVKEATYWAIRRAVRRGKAIRALILLAAVLILIGSILLVVAFISWN